MERSITVSKEDYLKAILEAESEGQRVISATLAHWLSVSAPAVTMALRRLKRDGYVLMRKDGSIHLSAQGKEAAYRTALRHHLIERMLSEIFGMAWYQIHDEAERLEHAVSPEFEAKLIERLGDRGFCPHGNSVLPESPRQRRKRGLLPLSDGAEQKEYTIASLYERDPKLLLFLHKLGIGPQVKVRLATKNYDDTLLLETPNGFCTLGKAAAEKIWVR